MINDYLQGINNATAGQTADVNTATQDLSTLQAGAGNLPQKLKDALNTKLNNNKDIINQQADTMGAYFNSGAEARQKYQNIWDPFEKAKLVEQQKTMALKPYDVLSGVLENRMGTVNDIVQSGIGGWQGATNAATTKLQAAQANLANALQAYQLASTQQSAEDQARAQAAAAEESKRQFGISSGQEQQKINNQVSQFNKEFALKQITASDGTNTKLADKTKAAWNDAVGSAVNENGYVNEQGVWNYINQNQGMLEKQGINVQDLYTAHAKMVGNRTVTATAITSPKSTSSYANTQMDLNTGKIVGNPVTGPIVLQPGQPGYADLSKLQYLQGQNANPYGIKLGGK